MKQILHHGWARVAAIAALALGAAAAPAYAAESTSTPTATQADAAAPACSSRTATIRAGRSSRIDLSCTTGDPQAGDVVLELVEAPEHGTVTDLAGGGVTYRSTSYLGPDRFTVRPRQGERVGAVVEVDVDVQAVAPPATDPDDADTADETPEPTPSTEPVATAPTPAVAVATAADSAGRGASDATDAMRRAARRASLEGMPSPRRTAVVGPAVATLGNAPVRLVAGRRVGLLALWCAKACTVTARHDLVLGGRTVRVGATKLRLTANGTGAVALQLDRRSLRRAGGARTATVVVRLVVRDATGGKAARGTVRVPVALAAR